MGQGKTMTEPSMHGRTHLIEGELDCIEDREARGYLRADGASDWVAGLSNVSLGDVHLLGAVEAQLTQVINRQGWPFRSEVGEVNLHNRQK